MARTGRPPGKSGTALTPYERTQRHRANHGRGNERQISEQTLRFKAEGKNQHGWLVEDGILDMTAVHIVVQGERVPDMTYNEALIAAELLVTQASTRDISAQDLIAARFRCSRSKAQSLMTKVCEKVRDGS
jgi:hypothetical protein